MKRVISNPFIQLWAIWFFIGLCVVAYTDKSALHLFFNQIHTPLLDIIFPYITHLAEGISAIIIVIGLLIYNRKTGLYAAVAFALAAITTQILKRFLFADILRPVRHFKGQESLYLIDGVQMHATLSFPSGHSTAIFAYGAFLALVFGKNKMIAAAIFIITLLVAYSRIYLNQHFFEDILIGSFIGTTWAVATYIFMENKKAQPKS